MGMKMGMKMGLHIKLPKRIEKKGLPWLEAEYYAKLYNRARSDKERQKVYESLLVNGGKWDLITRSISYLKVFEEILGIKFDFWK